MTTSPTVQTGIFDLVSNSGLLVKLVLLCLGAASVFCWGVIFTKYLELKLAVRENTRFLEIFWHGKNLEEIFSKTEQMKHSPVASVFRSAYRELKKLSGTERSPETHVEVDNIQRALARASQSELGSLEKHVSWLATTASAAPFVGLFGTVWGIMNSFHSIGATGSANLAVVAPGISEALIATAVGLAAAIPAVVAYNHFVNWIKRIGVDVDCFSQDLLNIVQRSTANRKKAYEG